MNKNRKNLLVIADLKANLSNEIKEGINCLEQTEFLNKIKEYEESNARILRDSEVYLNGMEKFKENNHTKTD